MLNRRDFLKVSGLALLLSGSNVFASPTPSPTPKTPLNSTAQTFLSSPNTDELMRLSREYEKLTEYLRGIYLFTYEEWKEFHRYRESPESSIKNKLINGPHFVEIKAVLMLQKPGLTWSLLTKKEKEDYKSKLEFFDSTIDTQDINIRYSLHLSQEEFISNPGAMALWYLHRQYSHRHNHEKTNRKSK